MNSESSSRRTEQLLLCALVASSYVAAHALDPGPALAQRTGGSIRGRVLRAGDEAAVADVVVYAVSPSLQGEQIAVTESDGTFTFTLLPPGAYVLRFEGDGYRPASVPDVEVRLGQTTPVRLGLVPTSIEAEEIVVQSEAPTISRGSAQTSASLDDDLLRIAPQPRRFSDAIEQVAPGTTVEPRGSARGISVLGATGLENAYIIDGLNVTGVGFGNEPVALPPDFFEAIELKIGGYMPEFGRSTGGIFNLSLRRGGNDFHGSVFGNFRPGFLQADRLGVYRAGESILRQDSLLMDMDFGGSLGGPIIRDRLWFFVGFNPQMTFTDVHRIAQARIDEVTQDEQGNVTAETPDGLPDIAPGNPADQRFREVGRRTLGREVITYNVVGRLTFALDAESTLSLSYIGNPGSISGVRRAVGESRSANGVSGSADYYLGEREVGTHNLVLNYQGHFLDRSLQVEAFAGMHTERDVIRPRVDSATFQNVGFEVSLDDYEPGACPDDPSTPFVDCPVRDYIFGGTGSWFDETTDRYTAGLRLTHLLAGHQIRYGVDVEYKRYASTRGYSGGSFEQHFAADPFDAEGGANWQRQYYARQDEGGPHLYGVDGNAPFSAVASTVTLSAFLQDVWEVDEHLTVSGGLRWDYEMIMDSEGRPGITIPDEIAPRLGVTVDPTGVGRSRIFASYGWFYESVPLDINQRAFSAEGTALYDIGADGQPVGEPHVLGGANAATVNQLQGQYHSEIILGAEYELIPHLVVGAQATYRNLERAIEDISPDDGQHYFIANPGVNDCDVPEEYREPLSAACAGPDGSYDPTSTVFSSPVRRYYGVSFTLRKDFSDHWMMRASYTLSRAEGNYTGLFAADNGQADPNISSQYDLPSLVYNRMGPLPNDRTHVIRVSGGYELGGLMPELSGLTVGLQYIGRSGTPLSYLGRHELYGRREVFILPRGAAGRTPFTHQVDMSVGYDIPLTQGMALNLSATVFNLFNFQEATELDQEYTTGVAQPNRTPGASIDDVEVSSVNPTFGQARLRQEPLRVQLSARLTF